MQFNKNIFNKFYSNHRKIIKNDSSDIFKWKLYSFIKHFKPKRQRKQTYVVSTFFKKNANAQFESIPSAYTLIQDWYSTQSEWNWTSSILPSHLHMPLQRKRFSIKKSTVFGNLMPVRSNMHWWLKLACYVVRLIEKGSTTFRKHA